MRNDRHDVLIWVSLAVLAFCCWLSISWKLFCWWCDA